MKQIFETVKNPNGGGTGHYINDHRCGGSKPLGGGKVTHTAALDARDIVQALECTASGRDALNAYAERILGGGRAAGPHRILPAGNIQHFAQGLADQDGLVPRLRFLQTKLGPDRSSLDTEDQQLWDTVDQACAALTQGGAE